MGIKIKMRERKKEKKRKGKEKEKEKRGQARWLITVIPALWEAKVNHLRPGVWDQPGQHGKIMALQKIQKFARCMAHTCNPSTLGGRDGRST